MPMKPPDFFPFSFTSTLHFGVFFFFLLLLFSISNPFFTLSFILKTLLCHPVCLSVCRGSLPCLGAGAKSRERALARRSTPWQNRSRIGWEELTQQASLYSLLFCLSFSFPSICWDLASRMWLTHSHTHPHKVVEIWEKFRLTPRVYFSAGVSTKERFAKFLHFFLSLYKGYSLSIQGASQSFAIIKRNLQFWITDITMANLYMYLSWGRA